MRIPLTTRTGILSAAVTGLIALSWVLAGTLPMPEHSMLVEISNQSDNVLDLIEIKHGNANSQETIVALQIHPGTSRKLVLNHSPGLGFNLSILAGGDKTEVCVGKTSHSRVLRLIALNEGDIMQQSLSTWQRMIERMR